MEKYKTSLEFGKMADQSGIAIFATGEDGDVIGRSFVVRPINVKFEQFEKELYGLVASIVDEINREFNAGIETKLSIINEVARSYEVWSLKETAEGSFDFDTRLKWR